MGGSSSKSSAELVSNTVVINETDLHFLNKTVNKVAVETAIENAKNCSSSITQSQRISAGNLVVGEGASATVSQDQEATLDFSCLQQDEVQMDVINNMVEKITSQVSDKTNADVLNKLTAAVASKSKSDSIGFPWGGSDATSEIKQTVNTHIQNKTKVDVENVIENSTFASFKNSNINDCLAKIIQSQEQEYGNIVTGAGSTLLLTQNQRATALVECIQQAKVGQRVIADLVKFSGLDLKVVKDIKTETEMDAKAESESEQVGLGGLIGGILKMFGLAGLLGGLGAMGPSISASSVLCCCCCCCLLILLIVGGGGLSMMSSGESEGASEGQYAGSINLSSASYNF